MLLSIIVWNDYLDQMIELSEIVDAINNWSIAPHLTWSLLMLADIMDSHD